MVRYGNSHGFSIVLGLVVVFVIVMAGTVGWYVFRQNQSPTKVQVSDQKKSVEEKPVDESAHWIGVTSQGGAFSMKVPDGWELTNYPHDYIGGMSVDHRSGIPGSIVVSDEGYTGHSLRFRVSISPLDEAGLGPQWSSPQPGLQESHQDFSVSGLQGKRYKAVFSGELHQTIYEYVLDVGNGKKLDIMYSVNQNEHETDDVATVEKVIKTIQIVK